MRWKSENTLNHIKIGFLPNKEIAPCFLGMRLEIRNQNSGIEVESKKSGVSCRNKRYQMFFFFFFFFFVFFFPYYLP